MAAAALTLEIQTGSTLGPGGAVAAAAAEEGTGAATGTPAGTAVHRDPGTTIRGAGGEAAGTGTETGSGGEGT